MELIPEVKALVADLVQEAIRAERKRIADRVRAITIYGTKQPGSDPYSPYGGDEVITTADAEMFKADLITAIEGEDQ